VQTATNVGQAITHPAETYQAVTSSVADTWNSGSRGQGRIIGDVLITAATVGAGTVKGIQAAGTAGRGLEFSHWIPARMGGPRTILNGNYVFTATHALSDPYRYRFMSQTWKAANPMPNAIVQQAVRLPTVYTGAGVGLGISTAAHIGSTGRK
jgi:hypothetical protein